MKGAVIIFEHLDPLPEQARGINRLLTSCKDQLTDLELLIFYHDTVPESFPVFIKPLSKITTVKTDSRLIPELYLQHLEIIYKNNLPNLLFFPSGSLGIQLATRLAFRTNGSSCVNVADCNIVNGNCEVEKAVYSSNLTARFSLEKTPVFLSPANISTKPLEMEEARCPVADFKKENDTACKWIKNYSVTKDIKESNLSNADIVLALGNGVKTKKDINQLGDIAGTFKAELGASRPVVMNGLLPMDRLIGASGASISPSICIVAGVSGMEVFTTAIKESDLIVAINIDADAQIFSSADVGIVDDLKEVLSELKKIITEDKNNQYN